MLKVTYYALRAQQVGDDFREAGDLIPEASEWPYLSAYLTRGDMAPVLVATLPIEMQQQLLDWEMATYPERFPDGLVEPQEDQEPPQEATGGDLADEQAEPVPEPGDAAEVAPKRRGRPPRKQ